MTSRRGIVGVAVLWILAALTAMALAALSVGRWQSARGRTSLDETKAIALAHATLLIARETDFALAQTEWSFDTGTVRLERLSPTIKDTVRLRCVAKSGRTEKEIETAWRRLGNSWSALYWRET